MVSVVCAALLITGAAAPRQLLPPPKDGDIRVVYWDLFNWTEVFVALDPQVTVSGGAPAGLRLNFSFIFAGHRPAARATDATKLDVRAYVGRLWAPQPELSFVVDGERLNVVDLETSSHGPFSGWDSVFGKLTLHDVSRIATAR